MRPPGARCRATVAPVLPATQSIARDSAFPSLAVASWVPQSSSSLVITTSPPSALTSGTCAPAHDIDRAEAFRTSELQHKLAHRRTGGGLGQPVARLKIVLDHGHHPGCNWIHQSLRGVLVREIARYGYDPFRWAHDDFTPRTPDVQKNDACARCGTCNARSKRLDDTDTLDAGTGWQRRLTTEAAAHDVHVARMNRRKSHADENFTWAGFRFGQFSYGEDVVGVAGAFKNKCFHKCSPSVVVSLR